MEFFGGFSRIADVMASYNGICNPFLIIFDLFYLAKCGGIRTAHWTLRFRPWLGFGAGCWGGYRLTGVCHLASLWFFCAVCRHFGRLRWENGGNGGRFFMLAVPTSPPALRTASQYRQDRRLSSNKSVCGIWGFSAWPKFNRNNCVVNKSFM